MGKSRPIRDLGRFPEQNLFDIPGAAKNVN